MAAQPSVADLVDLERYPVHDLESSEGVRLVESCRAELRRAGACKLDGFLRPEAVERMAADGAELTAQGFPNDDVHNVYFTEIDESLPSRPQFRDGLPCLLAADEERDGVAEADRRRAQRMGRRRRASTRRVDDDLARRDLGS